ncbi:MAG: hypothetical protein IPG63_00965 [Xanthomonadales bacterium]|nr:hypothetical protein [Xanthomonadales bacterium]
MRRPARTTLLSALTLASALAGASADAAIYCVNNTSELRNALADADGNGVDDTIRLAQGTFNITQSSLQTFVQDGEDLLIEGGWLSVFGPCNMLTNDASLSVLDGLDERPVLRIVGGSGLADISVRNLSIRNGKRLAGTDTAGLTIWTDFEHTGAVTIERVIFSGNSSDTDAAALYISARADITVRNSVFTGNHAVATAAMLLSTPNAHSIFLVNNTVAFNVASQVGYGWAAVGFVYGTPFLSNNIFYYNTSGSQKDFTANSDDILIANDIEQMGGTPSPLSIDNLALEPDFADPISLRLASTSPLLNVGTAAAIGGVGTVDIKGDARVVGGIDLGAHELDQFFRDGFE